MGNPLALLAPEVADLWMTIYLGVLALFLLGMWVFYSFACFLLAKSNFHRHGYLGWIPFVQLFYLARIADMERWEVRPRIKFLNLWLTGAGVGLMGLGAILFLVNDFVTLFPANSTLICGLIAGAGVVLLLGIQLVIGDFFVKSYLPEYRWLLLVFSVLGFPIFPVFLWQVARVSFRENSSFEGGWIK